MKNKKLLFSFFIIILIIIIILLVSKFTKKTEDITTPELNTTIAEDNNSNEQIYIEQNIYPVGNYELNADTQNKLIKSYEDLKSYLESTFNENFEEILSKYSDAFFEDRALALAYIKVENPNQIITIDSLNIDENNLEIGYSIKESLEEISSAYLVIVETDKTLSSVTNANLPK